MPVHFMAGEVRIVQRRFAEVDAGTETVWDDPEGIAPFTTGKLRAFRTNPLRAGPDDPAQLLALAGDRVIGRVDVFPGEITAFGETVPVYWGSALWVSPAFRSTAVGAMLVLRLSSLGRSAAGCGFSPAAFPIYRGGALDPVRHAAVRAAPQKPAGSRKTRLHGWRSSAGFAKAACPWPGLLRRSFAGRAPSPASARVRAGAVWIDLPIVQRLPS